MSFSGPKIFCSNLLNMINSLIKYNFGVTKVCVLTVKCVKSVPAYMAELLHKSMKVKKANGSHS